MNDQTSEASLEPAAPKPSRGPKILLLVALAATVGLAAVYGIGGLGGNAEAPGKCGDTLAAAKRLKPLARGDVAAFAPSEMRRDLSGLAFTGSDGAPTTLAAFAGRTVLLNFWATWCVPCRKEMPALDRLQAAKGSPAFEVVTINLDTRDPERSKKFLADIGVRSLAWHADPSLAVMKAMQKLGLLAGLPTTVLVDRRGCELGTMAGPADWDRGDAAALIDAALAAR